VSLLTSLAVSAMEKGLATDTLIRMGIRRLLAKRLANVDPGFAGTRASAGPPVGCTPTGSSSSTSSAIATSPIPSRPRERATGWGGTSSPGESCPPPT
jgi:hypothetical protein